eukprot:TRINITY_DN625_c0_g1_i1.p1 TRINITY_DN625_c0_g1~~TRINITY_DN625_c0_g1_i1.p1  ORF type:complete len:200 (-),score=63.58 TRINITY_DN625_c0_g1_i1:135-704(-)
MAAENQPKNEKATVEEVESSSDDEDVPALEGAETTDDGKGGKQSRSEKKARKAIAKLGMKPVPGVSRVTLKKSKSPLYVITRPDVYKSSASDTYVVFGLASFEDQSGAQAANAAKRFEAEPSDDVPDLVESGSAPAASDDSESVDETGVEAKDIELVIQQANCTRAAAVKALKSAKGDIVNAIMELTTM